MGSKAGDGDHASVFDDHSTSSGPGRAVVAVYAILAIAALGRSGYQLIDKYGEAPLAYVLSAVSAVIYVLATVALANNLRRTAWAAISFEFAGVIIIGSWSLAEPAMFPDPTVWSAFGQGYVWIPAVLPIIGFWWLLRTRADAGPVDNRSSAG